MVEVAEDLVMGVTVDVLVVVEDSLLIVDSAVDVVGNETLEDSTVVATTFSSLNCSFSSLLFSFCSFQTASFYDNTTQEDLMHIN